MAQESLVLFVKEALTRGIPRPEVERALIGAGWRASDTESALRSYADIAFPIPVPRPRPSLDARDAFVYLLMFTTLYITAFNLGTLAFQFIDRALVDPASPASSLQIRPEQSQVAIRWALSALIVAAPVFLFVASRIDAEVRREPARQDSAVRRGLTYLTLFVGAAVLIGDVIGLVYGLLNGDLTTRFLLKAGVVALIASAVMVFSRSLTVTVKGADLS